MTEETITVRQSQCQNSDCTVAETGICLEKYENYSSECPFYHALTEAERVEEP